MRAYSPPQTLAQPPGTTPMHRFSGAPGTHPRSLGHQALLLCPTTTTTTSRIPPSHRCTGLSLTKNKKRKRFITPTETNVHGDALCFMAKTHDHRNGIEQWLAVGGGWRLAVGGPWRLSLTKKNWGSEGGKQKGLRNANRHERSRGRSLFHGQDTRPQKGY